MTQTASFPDYELCEGLEVQTDDIGVKEPRFPARYLRFGAFEVDLKDRQLSCNGTSIAVQGKPYEALVALLEHPGEIVLREVLHGRLWPVKTGIDCESNLNTTVNKLRRMLATNAEHPVIQTIFGKGYIFAAKIEYAERSISEDAGPQISEEKESRFSWQRATATSYIHLSRIGFRSNLIILLIASILFGAAVELYAHRPFYQP